MSNVKITVNEQYDLTPRSLATSSDIVYIPGFSSKEDSPKNTPTLCQTVDDFLSKFGGTGTTIKDRAYQFSEDDVRTFNKFTVTEGDYDTSFLMAVELLNSGLSVLYENVKSETTDNTVKLLATANTVGADRMEAVTGGYEYTSCIDHTSETFDFKFMLDPKDFQVVGGLVSGTATVRIKEVTDHSNITVSIEEVSCDTTDGVSIAGSKITLNAVHDHYLDYLVFTAKVKIQTTTPKEGDKEIFAVEVIEGTNATAPANVVSRLQFMYNKMSGDLFEKLTDKGTYSVKYITSGVYPTFFVDDQSIADKMMNVAATRGDAVALIDPEYDPERSLKYNAEDSIYKAVNTHFSTKSESEATYAAMFMPYGNYSLTRSGVSAVMPASFGYLMSLATAVKTSPNWLAMAGVTRGQVPGYTPIEGDPVITNVIAEDYQPRFGSEDGNNVIGINAITNIRPYGQCIWGNRTLAKTPPMNENGCKPQNFLNTRNMISDIKKVAYTTAKQLMFEQNSDTLWLKFKSSVSPLLEQLRSGNGISDYKLIKGTTKFDGTQLARNELSATIRIYPMYAVEYFEITVVVSEEDVSV